MQEQLIFVISPPRSGSTLLQRMLGSHSQIMTHPEPHLITPLAYLGYHDTVDKAPYDHINSAQAIRLFVEGLPRQEADYLDALRSYADTMYGRMLSTKPQCSRFLDKTPAYALVLPFLSKLYPKAKYVVLTRHPLAIFSSYANSFFQGNWAAAHDFNPVVERYVPAIANFLRRDDVSHLHVRYEQLVRDPTPELCRIFGFLGLNDEPQAVNYGQHFQSQKGPGDPIAVEKHAKPVEDSLHKWAAELRADENKLRMAQAIIGRLDDSDLETWNEPRQAIFDPVAEGAGTEPVSPTWNTYTIQRRVLLALRKDVHTRPHGKLLRKVRYVCDVLLRE